MLVPAGPFLMGPERRAVHLDAFYVDRVPVTNEQFARFVAVTGYRPEDAGAAPLSPPRPRHPRQRHAGARLAQHPVVYVSWDDARRTPRGPASGSPPRPSGRRPRAAPTGASYPWGRAEPDRSTRANYGKAHGGTTPVGAFPDGASPYGVLDLAGNVWEWCEDYDDPSFYADGPSHNPRNTRLPRKKPLMVMRGGSWMYGARSLRTLSRTGFEAQLPLRRRRLPLREGPCVMTAPSG